MSRPPYWGSSWKWIILDGDVYFIQWNGAITVIKNSSKLDRQCIRCQVMRGLIGWWVSKQIHKCNLSWICLCNQLRVSPVCCLIELILNYSLNKIWGLRRFVNSIQKKEECDKQGGKKKIQNCSDDSCIPTENATKAPLLPVTPKTALLTHFFISSIDLRVMTLSLCLYLSSAVSPPPLQTVYRLHLCFHYTALFSIAELKLRLAVRHHSPLLPEQPESVNRLLRLIRGSAAC